MTASDSFKEFLADALAPLGKVTIRRMFGGAGVFRDGLMFGLIADDVLYFKVDDINRPAFEAEDMEPFSYARKDKPTIVMSYSRAPERLFDDPDQLTAWAREACAAARRNAQPKKKPARKSSKGAAQKKAESAPKSSSRAKSSKR